MAEGKSPVDVWLDERYRHYKEVKRHNSCGSCNHFFENVVAMKPGWGICMAESDTDDGEVAFVECYEGCTSWEPR